MIDIKKLRENPDWFGKKATEKGVDIDIHSLLELDKKRLELKFKIEDLNRQKKIASGKKQSSSDGLRIKNDLKTADKELSLVEKKYFSILYSIPNPAFDDIPIGDESHNTVLESSLSPKKFDFTPKSHEELGESLGIIDIATGSKVSGSRFYYLIGKGAELEIALMQYARDIIKNYGFQLVIPPVLISEESMWSMGYLEHGGTEETYHLDKDNLFLIGTAEQALGPMHKNKTFNVSELPLRYLGYSPSFRRESGSYGKDTKGIIRVHQFNKLEMFIFSTPQQSEKEHEMILEIEKKLVSGLELPYQVVNIASGDLGLPAAKKWDIEVWFPSQNKYRETHSTSNTTDFQARRLNTKYINDKKEKQFVHTVNGTAFAFGRIIAAIVENFQTSEGKVRIPTKLQPYTGFDIIE